MPDSDKWVVKDIEDGLFFGPFDSEDEAIAFADERYPRPEGDLSNTRGGGSNDRLDILNELADLVEIGQMINPAVEAETTS